MGKSTKQPEPAIATPVAVVAPGSAEVVDAGEEVQLSDIRGPFPNEHACRRAEPSRFDRFRRVQRSHEGKAYGVIRGHVAGGQDEDWEDQAYRYPKATWSTREARSHCRAHGGRSFEPASDDKAKGNGQAAVEEAVAESWYEIKNEGGGKPVQIYIFEAIGAFGIQSIDLVRELSQLPENAELEVRINSPGGAVHHAMAIYNALARWKGKVSTFNEGIAASAATIIMCAGRPAVMPENTLMFFHNPMGITLGNRKDHDKTSKALEKFEAAIASVYAQKTELPEAQIVEIMDEETWLSAKEAEGLGFVDEVTGAIELAEAKWGLDALPKARSTGLTVLPPLDIAAQLFGPEAAGVNSQLQQSGSRSSEGTVTPASASGSEEEMTTSAEGTTGTPNGGTAGAEGAAAAAEAARKEGSESAVAIVEACTKAGVPQLAGTFLKSGAAAEVVAQRIEACSTILATGEMTGLKDLAQSLLPDVAIGNKTLSAAHQEMVNARAARSEAETIQSKHTGVSSGTGSGTGGEQPESARPSDLSPGAIYEARRKDVERVRAGGRG